MESETEHILMLPFMAQGHIRPFIHLAHRLHSRTHFTITILTTPLNAHIIRSKLPPSSALQVAVLPFNAAEHGLPAAAESTDKLSLPLFISFMHASSSLQPHFRNFISTHFSSHRPPLCVIFDVFLGWADPVARSFGSSSIAFATGGAYGTAAYLSFWNELPHRSFSDDDNFSLPGFPDNHHFFRSQLSPSMRDADGSDDWSRYLQPQIRFSMKSSGWLCNSVEEIEPLGFQIFRNYLKSPVWAVGPLILEPTETLSSSSDECFQWLNSQKHGSVIYISFGSQLTISPTQMMELAMGLEVSNKPFLWVIRPPLGFDINEEFRSEWLPEGFEERVKKNRHGMLVHKWGPQTDILGHESTGGFLTHCGWNSVMEGLREGMPMVTWPLVGDQPYNSKMLVEEMGVAVELTRGWEGKVSKEEVKRAMERVLEREEGSGGWEMKKKAVEAGKKLKNALTDNGELGFKKGSSVKAIDDFVDAMVSARVRQAV